MKKRRNFRKKPKDNSIGLSVTVFNNNVEEALKRLKRKVKNSDLMQDLRKREHFIKPSIIKREKINLAKLRNHYKVLKEKEQDN
jgi:small subunit ribosomal protein S21